MKKRIVCTVTNDLNYDQRMQKICGSLARHGYAVTLVGRQRKSSQPLLEQPFAQKRLPCFFDKGKLFYLEYNLRLFFYLLFFKTDIICAIDLDTIMPDMWVARLRGKKLVYDAHEYFSEVPEVIHRPRVQKVWRWVASVAIPRADLCYTVSESLAKEFEIKYGQKFHVIRNVPYLTETRVSYEVPEDKFILYQGALNADRGLEELIWAMQRIPIKLYLIGEGDLSEKLRIMVSANGLEEKVCFMGYMRPAELKEFTPKAFIGYNLFHADSKSYYYSLNNKFFDYMHGLLPSLTSDYLEFQAVNAQYKVAMLTGLSEENIVLCIQRILENQALYLEMKKNCAAAREEFNWQKEEVKLNELYDAL